MKLNKLTLAIAAGSIMASPAFADQVFHLYGSTAYRKATEVALATLFNAGAATNNLQYDNGSSAVSVANNVTPGGLTSAEIGSTNVIWKGKLAAFPGESITIYANWAGSVGGIRSIADPSFGSNPFFLVDGGSYGSYSSSPVDLAMSDCDQASTPYDPSQNSSMNALSQTYVSVLEFVWAKGNGSPASLSNVGTWSLQALLNIGNIPMSQITGVPTDVTNMVYVTGRNDDSGTRILALGDSAYGAESAVVQYSNPQGSTYGYAAFGPGVNFDGDGYPSGGNVATALTTTRPASYVFVDGSNPHNQQSYLVGYIAVTDALNVPGLSAVAGSNTLATVTSAKVPTSQWLTYNGVTWSEPAITEGAYTYFGYEHCDTALHPTAAVATLKTALATEQMNQAGTVNVPGTMPISVMDIAHRADASVIAHD
jgi:hypothetical protein